MFNFKSAAWYEGKNAAVGAINPYCETKQGEKFVAWAKGYDYGH